MRLTLAWLAGRYDEPPAAVRADWDSRRDRCSVIAGSELGNRTRSEATRADGWGRTIFMGEGQGECVVAWDKARWKVDVEKAWALYLPRRPGTVGRLATGIFAPVVLLLDEKAGESLIVTACHLPAHVEGHIAGKGLARARRVREVGIWAICLARWSRKVGRMRRRHPRAQVVMCADFNVNLQRAAMRALVRRLTRPAGKGLRLVWTQHGTHGSRSIDGLLTTLPGGAFAEKAKASDHRAVIFTTPR